MSKRRPVYLKAVDVLALVLVGFCAASVSTLVLRTHSWEGFVFSFLFAAAFDYWFVRLLSEVRYLWSGRETRFPWPLRRRARPASPSPE
ncbi:hypothetical protein [Nocardioides marmorisolisilvae]|uniref:hypothetical protein n=1 Tax=Nocardioides marmorisolisilvae TaxID=1542737 RepID=UPI0011CDD1DB|nr:hypothetical protein [Nocardioides marmorisolisilvae]